MAADEPMSADRQITIVPDPEDKELLRPFAADDRPLGGFHGLLEVIPTRADYILDLIRANSLWPLLSGLSCCTFEMMSTAMSRHDLDRFGMFPFWASPRHAAARALGGRCSMSGDTVARHGCHPPRAGQHRYRNT